MAEPRLEGTGTGPFCRLFLDLGRKNLTGTLEVVSSDTAAEGRAARSFLFHQGMIVDLDNGRDETLLAEAILATGKVTPRAMRRATRAVEKNGLTLGAALVEEEVLTDDELLAAIQAGVAAEVTEAFSWPEPVATFTEHDISERLEDFRSELSEYFELLADPEELFLEAAHRLGRWDLVAEHLDLLRDVFYATPGTFHYFREPDTFPTEVRVLGAIDGTKDVGEVIEATALDSFEAIRVLRHLASQGEIELINPVQMFQLAAEHESRGHLAKACKLFQRARERGLNDFDVDRRLAQALDRAGRREEAALRYVEFSEKCIAQLRVDDAIDSLKRAARLCPRRLEALEALLELLLQHRRFDEAVAVALELGERRIGRGEAREALDLLLRLRRVGSGSLRLHEKIIEVAERCGEAQLAREERKALAQAFDERKDAQQVLEAYQRMFCQGDDSLEVRLKLVELHREQGNVQKAVEHLNGILDLGGKRRVQDLDLLVRLHETLLELRPGDGRANRWLLEHYLRSSNTARAVEILRAWTRELEKQGNLEEKVRVLERLVSLDDRLDHRWELGKSLEQLGRPADSRRELRGLANLAMRRRELDHARRALEHILKSAPLDIAARKAQVDLLELEARNELAAEKLGELATLEVLAGHVQEAEACCRRLVLLRPGDAAVVDKLGKLCLAMGDQQKALEQFLKAAKVHLENRNLGLARSSLKEVLALHPGHPEASALLARLEAPRDPAAKGGAKGLGPPAVSEPLALEREPFQQGTSVRTTVAGITARLRSLKAGGGGARTGGPGGKPAAKLASRLRSLRGGDGPASAPATAEESAAGGPPPGGRPASTEDLEEPAGAERPGRQVPAPGAAGSPGVSSSDELRSAAARLKALAAAKRQVPEGGGAGADGESTQAGADDAGRGTGAGPGEGEGVPGAAPVAATLRGGLRSSAGRLAALRRGGGG